MDTKKWATFPYAHSSCTELQSAAVLVVADAYLAYEIRSPNRYFFLLSIDFKSANGL